MPSISFKSLLFSAAALLPPVLVNAELVDPNGEALNTKVSVFEGLVILDDKGPNGGLLGLPMVQSHKRRVEPGRVPKPCLEWVKGINENTGLPLCGSVNDIEVFEVEYEDYPGQTIPICRCSDAPMSIDDMTDALSRIPVDARRAVLSVSARPSGSPGPDDCSAVALAGGGKTPILYNGDCRNKQAVLFHEVGHAIDTAVLRDPDASGLFWSDNDQWRNAVLDEGSCVPDGYAKNGWADNFAQFAVMAAYHYTVQDIFATFPEGELDCMKPALNLAIAMTKPIFAPEEKKVCNGPEGNTSEWVCSSPEAREKGQCEGLPDLVAPGANNAETLESAQDPLSQMQRQIIEGDLAYVWGSSTTPAKKARFFSA